MADQADAKAKSWTVPAKSKEVRLDTFARRCLPHLSRRALEQAIGDKLFTINGRTAKKGSKLRAGDMLAFRGPNLWLAAQPAAAADLIMPIVYEDSSLLVVDKPAGMATHGFSGRETGTLANFLAATRPELCHVGRSRWEPGLVHRLDRETSGLLLVAKTQAVFEALRNQFHRRQITKEYLALVWGQTEAVGSISYPLAHDPRDPRRMRALVQSDPLAKKLKRWRAVTRWRKLAEGQGVTLLEVEMETGVTHQIRVHLAAIGHAIVADTLYGTPGSVTFGLHRHFLHAWSLKFVHPEHGGTMHVEAGLPGDLQRVLERVQIKI
ncbi:MAG TPA: RluA family pseudouridine synthase [Candidatus Binatia bacterium]